MSEAVRKGRVGLGGNGERHQLLIALGGWVLTVLSTGGVEGLEKQIEEEAHAKKKEDDRRQRISTKTRNRLTQLLKGRQRESGLTNSKAQENLENLAR